MIATTFCLFLGAAHIPDLQPSIIEFDCGMNETQCQLKGNRLATQITELTGLVIMFMCAEPAKKTDQ